MSDADDPQNVPTIDDRFDPAFQRGFTSSIVTRPAPARTPGARPGYLQPAAPLAPTPPPVPTQRSVAPTAAVVSSSSFAPPAPSPAPAPVAEASIADPIADIAPPVDPAPLAPPERRANPIDIGLWILSALLVVAAYFVGTRGAEIQAHGYFVQADAYAFVFSQVMIGTAPLLLTVGLMIAITQLVRLSIRWERKHGK